MTVEYHRTPAVSGASVAVKWDLLGGFSSTLGSPVRQGTGNGSGNGFPAWVLDPASAEAIAGFVTLPDEWDGKTVDIDLIWTNSGAGAGDVVWRLDRKPFKGADGDDLSDNAGVVVGNLTTVTAPAQGVEKITTLMTGITVTKEKMLWLRIRRDAANAADTLANDAGVVALRVRRNP